MIEIDGVRILADPLLRNHVSILRRTSPIDTAPARGVDAVLLTHLHQDHFDIPSLRRLNRHIPVISPQGTRPLLEGLGFVTVTEVATGDSVPVGPVRVRATPAQHDGRRRIGRLAAPAYGYVVAGSVEVYHAGDTAPFPEMGDISDALDLALIPVAGWGPSLGPGHMDPRQAAQALTLLRPRVAVPVHWGTLRPFYMHRTARYLHDPPLEFARYAAQVAPDTTVTIVPIGGTLDIAPR